MPASSGSPSQTKTTVSTVAELESVESAQFTSGDLAFVTGTGEFFLLGAVDVTQRNGTTVLYTRDSNPTFNGGTAAPGRWLRTNIALSL